MCVDTLHIITLEPNCSDQWLLRIHSPNILVIESQNVGSKTIACFSDSSKEGSIFYHHYLFEGKINDSIIFQHEFYYSEKNIPLDTTFVIEE